MSSAPLHHAHGSPDHMSTVLIIDDDPALRAVTAMTLREAHVRCLTARNVDEGWSLLQSDSIQLVISDLHLGLHLGALTLLKRMRANPALASIPVIIASGERRKETLQAVMDAGASGYLIKPFPLDDLLTAVRRCLTGR